MWGFKSFWVFVTVLVVASNAFNVELYEEKHFKGTL